MNGNTLKRGDLVMARFRPDNVGVVEAVYGELCDVRRLGREPMKGVPAKAMRPVPPDVTLYAVGEMLYGVVWTKGVVAGAEGVLCWLHQQPPAVIERSSICILDRRLQPCTAWEPIAGILAKEDKEDAPQRQAA